MREAATPPSAPAPAADESALVERLRAGDEAAYETLVRERSGAMLAVARRFFRDESDAHDAVQDAFLSAFKAMDSFEAGSKLSTWLHRITVNACLMKLRTRARRPERSIEDLLPKFQSDGHRESPSPAWNDPPGAGIESRETQRTVRACIDQLPESYRVVLVLRDIEGLDTASTAAALDLTPNTVKVRLHRARQALRELLDPHLRREDP